MKQYVEEPAKKTIVVDDADVVVVGGGMAGVSAAITAARAGASTVLVEKFGFCGGLASVSWLILSLDMEAARANSIPVSSPASLQLLS